MKKTIILKFILIALIFFQGLISYSQNKKPFSIRYNKNIRGDILLIGNNILNRYTGVPGGEPNDPYNGDGKELGYGFRKGYIDIDGDPSTFNSSSANLNLPNPACSKIIYAGLYWAAGWEGKDPIDKVKLKTPGGAYIKISGSVIYRTEASQYASYADVTSYITGLSDPNGTYTVADISTSRGDHSLSGGWSLFIVYENATLPEKTITSFDGFSINGIVVGSDLDIPVSGFTTAPSGPILAKFAFSAIEGDQFVTGDYLKINGVKVKIPERPEDNFFNSSITSLGHPLNDIKDRTPNSSNTLGFDAGVFEVPNKDNSVIKNGATSATISLGGTSDIYFYYFSALVTGTTAPVEKVKTVFLCDGGAALKAADGYTGYEWKDSDSTVFGGNNQEVVVTKAGTYTVNATSSPPCPLSITQSFDVKERENSLNKFADNIDPITNLPYVCTSDGKPFPKIVLCDKDAKKDITLNLTGATTISWQENEAALPISLDDDCPNKSAANWTTISTEPKYTADKVGAYRLVVTYNNSSATVPCTNTYYFNVTKNKIVPTFTTQDVICGTKGSITITKPITAGGHNYEYSLDGVVYQDSNVFNNMAAGTHKVYIRTKDSANKFEKCEYTTEEIKIADVSTLAATLKLTTPLTDCSAGEITVTATNGVEPYSCYVNDSTTPQTYPKIPALTAKEYKIKVLDSNKCETTATITVAKIPGPTTTAIELD